MRAKLLLNHCGENPESTYSQPSDFSSSNRNSFNAMISIVFWTYMRVNTKRVITRLEQTYSSSTNSSMRTSRKQRVHLSSCFDSLSMLSIYPKLGQLSLRKASLSVESCKSSFIRQGYEQVGSSIIFCFFICVFPYAPKKKGVETITTLPSQRLW